MHWIILTLLAIFSRATYGLSTKMLSNQLPVLAATQSILFNGVAAVMAVLVSPLFGGISFAGLGDVWLVALIMMVASAIGNVVYFVGQRHLDVGTTQIAFSSILVWGTLLSILFLGSQFSLLQAGGIVLLLGAIVLAQYRKGVRKINAGVLYIVAAAAMFAAFQVTSAVLAKHLSAATYLLLAYAGPALLPLVLYGKTVKRDLAAIKTQPLHTAVRAVLFAALTSLLYYVFSYFAYRSAPDRGVVVLLLTTQVIVSVILGVIFLRERDHLRRKLLAGVLAVVAGLLIKA